MRSTRFAAKPSAVEKEPIGRSSAHRHNEQPTPATNIVRTPIWYLAISWLSPNLRAVKDCCPPSFGLLERAGCRGASRGLMIDGKITAISALWAEALRRTFS